MSDETMVRVPLTVEQRAEHADTMAGLLAQIAAIRRQKADADDGFREDIKALDEQLQALGRVLREGAEDRAQLDLTFPQEQAAKALHDVAAAACTCDSPDAPVKSIDCPIHGVETAKRSSSQEVLEAAGVVDAEGNATESFLEGAEVAADYAVPAEAQVDVRSVEEPPAVADFGKAKTRRSRRAEA